MSKAINCCKLNAETDEQDNLAGLVDCCQVRRTKGWYVAIDGLAVIYLLEIKVDV